jgi:hypothetical protein
MATLIRWPLIGGAAIMLAGGVGAASAAYYRILADSRPAQPDILHGWTVRIAAHGQVFYVTAAESWLSRAWIVLLPLAIPCVLVGFIIAARSARVQ